MEVNDYEYEREGIKRAAQGLLEAIDKEEESGEPDIVDEASGLTRADIEGIGLNMRLSERAKKLLKNRKAAAS